MLGLWGASVHSKRKFFLYFGSGLFGVSKRIERPLQVHARVPRDRQERERERELVCKPSAKQPSLKQVTDKSEHKGDIGACSIDVVVVVGGEREDPEAANRRNM